MICFYYIIVFGDLDGNGIIDMDDYNLMSDYLDDPDLNPLDDLEYFAGDVVDFGDGITQDDLDFLYDVIMGLEEISQNP